MTTRLNNTNLQLKPKSIVNYLDVEYGLVDSPLGFRLAVLARPHATAVEAFEEKLQSSMVRHYLSVPKVHVMQLRCVPSSHGYNQSC